MSSGRATRLAARFASCVLAVTWLLAGCAGGGGRVETVAEGNTHPDWIRIVPAATDEKWYYVGGCSSAADQDEGVACAREDAIDQLAVDADDRFRKLFDETLLDARTQTTSMERFRFKTDASEAYLQRLRAVVRVEDTHHRLCADGSVCSTFVLATVSHEASDAALFDVLSKSRRVFREEGSINLADLAERMQRAIE